MKINEIKKFKVTLQGRENPLELSLDMRAMEKMIKLYGNAMLLLSEFAISQNFESLIKVIRCLTPEDITEEELIDNLHLNAGLLDTYYYIVDSLITNEVIITPPDAEEVTEKN